MRGLSSGTVDCFMARRLCGIRRPIYMWAGEKLLVLAWTDGPCSPWYLALPAQRGSRHGGGGARRPLLLSPLRQRTLPRPPLLFLRRFRALLRRRRGGGGHSDPAPAPSATGVRLVFVAGGSELPDSEVYFYFPLSYWIGCSYLLQ